MKKSHSKLSKNESENNFIKKKNHSKLPKNESENIPKIN